MGKVCVCGAAALEVDYQARTVKVDGKTFKEGDWLSIDGTAGEVFAGRVATAPSEIVPVLIDDDEAAKKHREVQELPAADEVVRPGDAHVRCAPTPTSRSRRRTRSRSAPSASACAAPSTCSSKATASTRCAR